MMLDGKIIIDAADFLADNDIKLLNIQLSLFGSF